MKQDRTIKSRMVYNGKPTRELSSREHSSNLTAALKSIIITGVLDAHGEHATL